MERCYRMDGRIVLVAVALSVAACAVTPPAPVAPSKPESPMEGADRRAKAAKPKYNLTGYPPAVRDGYIDGCETAKRTQYARKDAARMSGDPQYSMGWNDGFSICKGK
jgi:hypothetical protein